MVYRIAVIGLGKIAQDQHLPCIAKNEAFELAAVVSSRPTALKVPCFRTPDDLFASGIGLDAVSLCMPPEPRQPIARKAFAAGLHVLSEKPPTPTMGEFTAMARDAAAAKRILFTTWHSQYNRAVDEAKRRLAGQTVTRLHVEWKEDVRHWHPGQDWIWEPGGFGVFDPAINAFSIVTKILPQPIFVQRAVLHVPSNKATPVSAEITFKPSWDGAAELTAALDWLQTGEQTWNIDVDTAAGLKLQLRKGGTELYVGGAKVVAEPSQEYEAIYAEFAELLASGRSHVDGAPIELVSDCFMIGRRVPAAEFV